MLKIHRTEALRRPKRIKIPNSLVFLDTETDEVDETPDTKHLVFKSGCMIFVNLDKDMNILIRQIYHLYSITDFYDYIEQIAVENSSITVFAHNIGFDLRILKAFHTLYELGWKSKAPIINNRLFVWNTTRNRKNIQYMDTANLGVSTVEELGKIIGLPKLDIDFNIATKEELEIYCLRDCEIIELFVLEYLRFIVHYELGGFRATIASQSLHTFLYRFYSDNIFPHRLPKVMELEECSYHGGRTEAFYLGKLPQDTYALLDINSMYAYILSKMKMPIDLLSYREGENISISKYMNEENYIIAECLINTNEPVYPLVMNKRLCFPTGRFKVVLHQAELEYAIQHKHIIKVYRYALYRSEAVFKDYASFFLNERAKQKELGNAIWDDICKKYNNALYGKYAQHGYRRKILDTTTKELFGRLPYFNHITDESGQFIIWNGIVIDEFRKGLAKHSCLAIAGAVTAYGRIMLWELGKIAGLNNWFYCDTDSLLVNTQGAVNLITQIDHKITGKLKLVKLTEHAVINGAKDYILGSTIKIKGIKKNAIRLKEDTFEQWNFQSVIAWLNNGGDDTVKLTKVIKHQQRIYNKGIVQNGTTGRVFPYRL